MTLPKISVVIPVGDDEAGLREVMAGLAGQTMQPDEIVVVEAGNAPLVRVEPGPSTRFVPVGPALPGRARNEGARVVRNAWAAFIDAGTVPSPTWLEAFSKTVVEHPAVDFLFGAYEPRIEDEWDWAAVATYIAAPASEGVRLPTSASVCARRASWERLGGMREDLRAGEDLLFFDEIKRSGSQIVVVPEAKVLWRLPAGLSGHFRRLRLYSSATWRTDLARRWQLPVIRMYFAGAVLALAAVLVHPSLLAVLAALASVRLVRTFGRRRAYLPRPITARRLIRLPLMLAAADSATLLGALDAAVQPPQRGRPAEAPR